MIYDHTCQNGECRFEFPIRVDSAGVWEESCPKCDHEIDADEVIESTKQDPDFYYEQA